MDPRREEYNLNGNITLLHINITSIKLQEITHPEHSICWMRKITVSEILQM